MKEIIFVAYDTLCSLRLPEPVHGGSDKLLDQARTLALKVQNTLNMYDPQSELSRLCSSYTPGKKEKVSKMLWEFVKLNLKFSQQTEGSFDFTVGPLMKLWDFAAEKPKRPSAEKLREAAGRVGYGRVHVDLELPEVWFDAPGMVLDPGASGKGYALEVVCDFLRERGVEDAVLDFGGNLFAIGGKRKGDGRKRPWRAAVRSPNRGEILGTVELYNRGIGTSSWYEHGFEMDGTVYYHLLDPATGLPQRTDISSVSILSSSALYTDLMSTAFFIMGFEQGCKLAERIKNQESVDLDYVVLKSDGEIEASEGAHFKNSVVDH